MAMLRTSGKGEGGDHEYRPEEQVHKAKSKKRREEKKSKIKKKRKLQDARTQEACNPTAAQTEHASFDPSRHVRIQKRVLLLVI